MLKEANGEYHFQKVPRVRSSKVSVFTNALRVLGMEYIVVESHCTCILRENKIFFHPAKFDNFKDEKISDFKTVSVSQRKNLLD